MTSRVKGPNRPGGGVDGAPPIDEASEASAIDATAEVRNADAVAGAEAVRPSGALDAPAQVAVRLKAGEITVEEAVELLIDDAVERQVSAASARSPEVAQKLRELLRQYAAADPQLAARIRRLTLLK
jgi:hypothetical protein